MNRLKQLFHEKKNILSVYYTAGFPNLEDTVPVLTALQTEGVDLVEIGMPFSDPLADGPTIQKSSEQALRNGMSLNKLFEQLAQMRETIHIPIVLMGYYNPVFKYGVERFIKKCREVGVDGVILPDLPFDEYCEKYQSLFETSGLANIFLITPQTTEARIRLIDTHSNGFIYMVSSAATTGTKKGMTTDQIDYFKRVQALQLQNPCLIGFGISDHETYSTACEYASGAIVGSAFVKQLDGEGASAASISSFVKKMRNK